MSHEASNWATYQAPRRRRFTSMATYQVLLTLADCADPDGRNCYPSRRYIARQCGLSVKTVSRAFHWLEEEGFIRKGDQEVLSHVPAQYRPTVWTLCIRDENRVDTPDQSGKNNTETTPEPQTGETPDWTPDWTSEGTTSCPTELSKNYRTKERVRAREKTEQKQTTTNKQLDSWQPNQNAIALAVEYGMDAEYEGAKFRDRILANGSVPADIDAAFRNWLRSGHDRGIVSNPQKPPSMHRHTWKCSHTLKALGRSEETALPDELAMATAAELNKGAEALRTMEAA